MPNVPLILKIGQRLTKLLQFMAHFCATLFTTSIVNQQVCI